MKLQIENKIIDTDINIILNKLKLQLNNGLLNDIKDTSDNVRCTCPFHKGGKEAHPSMNIYKIDDNPNVPYGFYRCFTCGEQGPLYKLIGYCLDGDDDTGKQWLLDNFGNIFIEKTYDLPEINLKENKTVNYLNESILNNYAFYHPYLKTRNISIDTAIKFKLGFDKTKNVITFPVWDDKGNLVMITERSVKNKSYHIPGNMNKPIYLLNYVKALNINTVVVCESQINALTCWQWGYPAIGLFGTGSKYQYDILKKSGIRHYILAFDGDEAGRKGAYRFKINMPSDILIDDVIMPSGKDINDITKELFDFLLNKTTENY